MGQEAVGVATCACLRRDDYLVPYMSRSYLLGKGLDLKALLAEQFGRATGCNRGVSGESHVSDPNLRIIGRGGVLGGGYPIAVGLGYAAKMRGKGETVICQSGEGATNRGSFHESLNMASVWNLPIVFICENNYYAEFTPLFKQMKVADVSVRAQAYDIPGVTVDGNDILAVHEVMRDAVQRARDGSGPTLVEAKTYRWRGHYEGDPMAYRTAEELEEWKRKDPLQRFRDELLRRKALDQGPIDRIEKEVQAKLTEAINFALESPLPSREDVLTSVYA